LKNKNQLLTINPSFPMPFLFSNGCAHAQFGSLAASASVPLQAMAAGCAVSKPTKTEAADAGAYHPFFLTS
jgi:hypothetical protein